MALQIASFDELLLYYVRHGYNKAEAQSIIARENLYNVADSSKNTLLHIASQSKNTAIAKYLVESGSTVDVTNDQGKTPLMFAIENDCNEIAEFLMESGADINAQDDLGKSVIQKIGDCDCASDKVLGILLQKLRDDCSNDNETIAEKLVDAYWPLHKVVQLRDAALTRIILQNGFAPGINATTGPLNQTALHVAAKSIDVENVKLLLEYNAGVNIMDLNTRTPLWYVYDCAADEYPFDDRLYILKRLIGRGAGRISDMYGINHNADRILMFGSIETIRLLLQTDNDVLANDHSGLAVRALLRNKDPRAIEELREKSYFGNLRDGYGISLLMVAAHNGKPKSVELILNELADIDAMRATEATDVLGAIVRNILRPGNEDSYKESVQILLERGAEIHSRDDSTLLQVVLNNGYFQLGELMISQLALREALGTPIKETVSNQINSCDRFKSHFELSKRRLTMDICQSITLFDLLAASDKRVELERYVVGNDELVSKIPDFMTASPDCCYFRSMLHKRLAKIIFKHEAVCAICKFTGISYNRVPLIVNEILSYLESQDMRNLIDASMM